MQSSSKERGPAEGLPLTHSAYMAVCHTAEHRPFVQVRKRFRERPLMLCGQVLELDGSGLDLFKIGTVLGAFWVSGKNVRMCSGDGRCICEPLQDEGRTSC